MARRLSLLIPVLAVACGGDADLRPPARAGLLATPDRAVAGTIEATIDGTARTWYVVAGEIRGTPYASAAWYEPRDGRVLVTIGGFDTRTPPFDTFEQGANGTPVSFGDYEGPVFSFILETTPTPTPYEFRFGSSDGTTGMVYMSAATFGDLGVMHMAESGRLEVTTLERSGDRFRAEGTFEGTFANMGGGAAVRVTDGRFSVRDVPPLREVSGGR